MVKTRVGICAGLVAVAPVVTAAAPAAAQAKEPRRYVSTAFAVNMGAGPNAGTVDIVIGRSETPADVQGEPEVVLE